MEDKQLTNLFRAIYGLICIVFSLFIFAPLFNDGDFDEELAKEYGIPIGEFSGVRFDYSYFPFPHNEYYVVTRMGEKYILATEYFGFFLFKDENVKKFCHPEIYEEINKIYDECEEEYNKYLKERGY